MKCLVPCAQSCPTLCDSHGLWRDKLLGPWNFPGKNSIWQIHRTSKQICGWLGLRGMGKLVCVGCCFFFFLSNENILELITVPER